MKCTIESTEKIVELRRGFGREVPARIWEGKTESGVPVLVFVTRIAPAIAPDDPRQAEFVRELKETAAPTAAALSIPARLIL